MLIKIRFTIWKWNFSSNVFHFIQFEKRFQIRLKYAGSAWLPPMSLFIVVCIFFSLSLSLTFSYAHYCRHYSAFIFVSQPPSATHSTNIQLKSILLEHFMWNLSTVREKQRKINAPVVDKKRLDGTFTICFSMWCIFFFFEWCKFFGKIDAIHYCVRKSWHPLARSAIFCFTLIG